MLKKTCIKTSLKHVRNEYIHAVPSSDAREEQAKYGQLHVMSTAPVSPSIGSHPSLLPPPRKLYGLPQSARVECRSGVLLLSHWLDGARPHCTLLSQVSSVIATSMKKQANLASRNQHTYVQSKLDRISVVLPARRNWHELM